MKDDILSQEITEEERLLQKKEKEKRIKKEINRLKKLFKDMPQNTMDKVSSLIKNAAFMTVTLEDLQETINCEGTVSEYKNGENQFGTKKSPEVEIYNTMIKNHMGIMKQLTDLMPEKPNKKTNENDPLFNIINRGKNG
ncbi:hypothetical protein [Clostridium beijerinckii]|uniref:hypothetical protein n=1 Tax=Clostridium beijerinckii TaxID=1520 RepID=UPI0014948FBD|nr:hypothetical protein [Clostridium beijerinckii]NOW07845.1 cell fate (sporulation/competence/biofilm development) regulator YlbF (YheA/YmcA/DUF963 family) [Clostridium beijerinckii]NYC05476.1 cell fate (sporulation/competence/biofilm development) regulator YlbF (YheA/YmcA/DUF963 family) [Clostridium beijerinckii]